MGYTLSSYEPVAVELDRPPVPDYLVDREVDRLLEERSEYRAVARPVEFGDYLTLTTEHARLDETEVPYFQMERGFYHASGEDMPAAFDHALVGLSAGESKHIDVPVAPALVAGDEPSTLHIDVTVEAVLERTSPELTDAFIAESFPPAHDVASLREQIAAQFTPSPILKSDPQFEYLVISALAERLVEPVSQSDVPAGDDLVNFRMTCAIDALAAHLGVEVSEEELTDLIPAPTRAEREAVRREFEEQGQHDELVRNVVREKALRWLRENSTVTYR